MRSIVTTVTILLFPSLAWACGPMFKPTYPADFLVTGAVAGAVTLLVMRRNDPSLERTSQLLLIGAWAILSYFAGGLMANEFALEFGAFARVACFFFGMSILSVFTAPSAWCGKLLLSAVIVGGIFFSVILFMQTKEAQYHSIDPYPSQIETQITF